MLVAWPQVCARELDRPVWRLLPMVVATGLLLRLVVAIWSQLQGHPDEIFQYLEQAHRLVFGYGFVPWEYRFGTRNWILPGLLAAPLAGLRAIGLDQPAIYVPTIKCLCALISVSVIYSSYFIGRNLLSENTGRLAAVFCAFWFELVRGAVLATPEVLGTYAILGALAMLTGRPTMYRSVTLGILLATSAILRVQYVVPAAVAWFLVIAVWGRWHAAGVVVSGALIVSVAALVDAWTWGLPLISYWNSIVFNVVHGVSKLFGHEPFYQYVVWMFFASAGLHLIAIMYGMLRWRRTWPFLLLIASVLVPHAIVAHKEYRFVFAALPLLLLLLAYAAEKIREQLQGSAAALTSLFVAVFVLVSSIQAASLNILRRDGRLLASLYLSQRNDVRAVLDLSRAWIHTGGFYYLHHNVPFYLSHNVASIPADGIREIASHVIVIAGSRRPPGFSVEKRFDDVELLRNTAPPKILRALPFDGREPQQLGIDGRYTPNVDRRF